MQDNPFQHIITSSDIYSLTNTSAHAATSKYTLLVTQGSADIIYNGTNYRLTERMVLLGIFANDLTVLSTSADWQCHILINTTQRLNKTIYSCLQIEKDWHKKMLFVHSHPVLTISNQVLENMQQIFQMFLAHSDSDNIYHQRIQYLLGQSALFELFAWIDHEIQQHPPQRLELDQSTDRKQQLLLEFMRLLQENKGTERRVSWYAEQMCITVKYLQAICRSTANASPIEIINQLAINEIKSLLSNTNMTIKEIAIHMQFSSASSFCKYFHRLTGMSALSYREQR